MSELKRVSVLKVMSELNEAVREFQILRLERVSAIMNSKGQR